MFYSSVGLAIRLGDQRSNEARGGAVDRRTSWGVSGFLRKRVLCPIRKFVFSEGKLIF